jgi:hypothetical protein
MYAGLKPCINTGSNLSDLFSCIIGTRQGCILSPILFTLFVNKFIQMGKEAGCQDIYLNEDTPNIAQLLFADDMADTADTADTVVLIKRQIYVLSDFCKRYAMKVNMQKTEDNGF